MWGRPEEDDPEHHDRRPADVAGGPAVADERRDGTGGATEGDRFERVTDRRAAIARALEVAQPGDLVLIAPHGHPLASRRRLNVQALQAERFILREPGSGTRLATDGFFERQGFQPDARMTVQSQRNMVI